ncbi:hypothetical protein E1B28_002947 [Marasmius oreades]|uniref:Nephrocystin 3-like N-terminal domain-containing protein n=1 Tax=Marasmius oreades TaxID=181124 RepID=A0A9P7UJU6_9AGAR|nr:uncharacterized protein E1B28_002947 [Marasmius oreades]KAG7085383.1 hypothetical protein E1B28_002947 [Marasmius oreades]
MKRIRRLRPSYLKPPGPVEPPHPVETPISVEAPRPLSGQHILEGARDTTIGHAVFNNVGGDQVQIQNHNHNHYFTNRLWEAIKDIGASHNSEQQVDRGCCLPGTREAVLELIRQWRVSGCNSPPVCWLSGAAGVGKSAIALSVAEECEKDGLVASFFFFRSDPKRNNPSSLVLSIVHGLVVKRPHLKALINEKIAADPGILAARLENQYKELVLENLDHPTPPSSGQRLPDLVIIDGLDECGDSATQRRVLDIIFSTYRQPFYSPLRYLICSRPESWIKPKFQGFSGLNKHIKLDNSFLPRYDIELYLNHQFQEIRRDYPHVEFPDPWPSPNHFEFLVDKSDGQFIFATTATMFIKADYVLPTDQLCIIVDTISNQSSDFSRESPLDDLDKLYLVILRANPDRDKRLLPILAMIVVVDGWRQRSPEFIERVLGLSRGTVTQTLRAMHSVLNVGGQYDDIKIYHKSFTDFLLDRARSREFFIDKSEWEDLLARRWTRSLTEQCKEYPKLLRLTDILGHPLEPFVDDWNKFLDRVDGRMSSALVSELDACYHVALSISAELVGHEVLLHILSAILLLPSDLCFSYFIEPLLELEVLDQALDSIGAMIQSSSALHRHFRIMDRHSTLRDFLLDRERSKRFFVETDYQKAFFAQKCLRLLQMDDGEAEDKRASKILIERWVEFCTDVDNPTKGLLSELYRMDLGTVLAKFLDRGLYHLFLGFETISTWLESRTNGVTLPALIGCFKNVQRGFHIRSTRQDVDSGRHHNIITMIILSIVKWTWWPAQTSRRLCASLIMRDCDVDDWSESLRASVNIKLRSAEFCGCSGHAFTYNRISTPILGKTGLYHINIPAGCAQIFKAFVSCLEAYESQTFTHEEYCSLADNLLLWLPALVTRCLPLPEILPHFQTLLDMAKTLGRGALYRAREDMFFRLDDPEESRGKLLSWLESFPADCANEVETAKNDLLSLIPLDE